MTNDLTKSELLELFKSRVNEGEGFAVGGPDEDVNEIAGYGPLLDAAQSTNDIAVYGVDDGVLTLVGDVNGPWAIEV